MTWHRKRLARLPATILTWFSHHIPAKISCKQYDYIHNQMKRHHLYVKLSYLCKLSYHWPEQDGHSLFTCNILCGLHVYHCPGMIWNDNRSHMGTVATTSPGGIPLSDMKHYTHNVIMIDHHILHLHALKLGITTRGTKSIRYKLYSIIWYFQWVFNSLTADMHYTWNVFNHYLVRDAILNIEYWSFFGDFILRNVT